MYKAAIGGEKIIAGQILQRDPPEVIEDSIFEFPLKGANGKKLKVYGSSVPIGMADACDVSANLGVNPQFFLKLPRKGLFGSFSGLDFAARELPLEFHRLSAAPLANEYTIATADEGGGD